MHYIVVLLHVSSFNYKISLTYLSQYYNHIDIMHKIMMLSYNLNRGKNNNLAPDHKNVFKICLSILKINL